MKKISLIISSLLICVLFAIFLAWISTWKSVEINNATFYASEENKHPITLPYSGDFIGRYTLAFNIENNASTTHEFRLIPDEELVALRINGTNIDLTQIPLADRQNYNSGFLIDFNNLKPNETNRIEVELINQSNPTGFRIELTQHLSTLQLCIAWLILCSFGLFLSRHLKITNHQKIILIFSLALSIFYLSKTDERTRTFDVFEGGGHKDYIEYIINNHSFPNPGEGWEYHQPPLYYLTAALVKKISHITNSSNYSWAQLLALYFWTIFLTSSLAALKLTFNRNQLPLLLASLSLCLWPSGIIHSIRIGNDLALYAFYSLGFLYMLLWWKSRKSTHLFWSSLWMGASLLTKSNGLALAATLCILLLVHTYSIARKRIQFENVKYKLRNDLIIFIGLFFLALLLNFGDNIYYYLKGSSTDWLLSNVSQSINSGLKVTNNIPNYLIFDSATFLQNPFISTWEDISGRQYFWNFVLRSSLTSEFSFATTGMKIWGITNGILLLTMISSIFIYALQKQPTISLRQLIHFSYRNLPWVLMLIIPFGLLLAYRIKVPLSCNTDFRYIYPVLLNILYFTVIIWKDARKYSIPAILSLGMTLISLNTLIWIFML